MPSSASNTKVLHLVMRSLEQSDALARALSYATEDDAIVLLQNAAPAATTAMKMSRTLGRKMQRKGYVLGADLDARGYAHAVLREDWQRIDESAWVALAVACQTSITWY
jgi:sulfur relay protein TusB/DsrH